MMEKSQKTASERQNVAGLDCLSGFGLRSASGESGVESGEKRLANRSRSATSAAEAQTEARRFCGSLRMPARDERAV